MSAARPTPEDFLKLIQPAGRGRLKVYLGSSAGVGKTYSMLNEGNRLREKGVDVVIGYVEPHSRPETTAQIGQLEIIPVRWVTHEGLNLREMDVAAVLARRPAVALVDELAHTNAPGSKNPKRYEDVEELLATGISVITTLNIQHLESLYNIVENATGVQVRERLPDRIVAQADQIVHVDLEAEDLIDRLKAGKIYAKEQADAALKNFFTVDNLTRLRELALSETANVLDRRQRDLITKSSKPSVLGKVMVALSSRGRNPQALLRKAARLATQLNAEWYAVYVRTPQEAEERISAATHRSLYDTLDLAQKMGGSIVVLKEQDVAHCLSNFARENGMSHVIIGRSEPSSWPIRLGPTFLEKLISQLDGIDVIVV
ncbi:MAG TPA: sensor histidine kinase KdpD [Opitutaceae bacterium]|nr:sensor histidine kinase KdpD [Opitutaceae bacterium]